MQAYVSFSHFMTGLDVVFKQTQNKKTHSSLRTSAGHLKNSSTIFSHFRRIAKPPYMILHHIIVLGV